MAEEKPGLLTLPAECIVECLAHLSPRCLGSVSQVCSVLEKLAAEDTVWRAQCVRACHGHLLDFRESLGSFCHPAAREVRKPRAVKRQRSTGPWQRIYRQSAERLRRTIAIDYGRGYAKFGLCDGSPSTLQLCQPNAEASADSLYATIFRRLRLRRSDLASHAAIVSEPFALAAARAEDARNQWRVDVTRQLLREHRVAKLCLIDSASLCLFAHKFTSGVHKPPHKRPPPQGRFTAPATRTLHSAHPTRTSAERPHHIAAATLGMSWSPHIACGAPSPPAFRSVLGVVLNIGFASTYCVPVIRGHVVRAAVRSIPLGGAALTQCFAECLQRVGVDMRSASLAMRLPPITVARDVKEAGCEVWPTSLQRRLGHDPFDWARLAARDDEPLREVDVRGHSLSLGWVRYLPAELLFGPGNGLQHTVLAAVEAAVRAEWQSTQGEEAAVEGWAAKEHAALMLQLMGRVALSGGSAVISGLAARCAGRCDVPRAPLAPCAPSSLKTRGRHRRYISHRNNVMHHLPHAQSPSLPITAHRLQHELSGCFANKYAYANADKHVSVLAAHPRDRTTWLGAAVLAGSSDFEDHWCIDASDVPTLEPEMPKTLHAGYARDLLLSFVEFGRETLDRFGALQQLQLLDRRALAVIVLATMVGLVFGTAVAGAVHNHSSHPTVKLE